MQVLLATNNEAKIERFKKLVMQAGLNIELVTPKELGIEAEEVEENGATLAENAELKAQVYRGKVTIPILSNDTGFYVEGEGFIDAPKRMALGNSDTKHLTKEEIAKKLLTFWKKIATKHGGTVDAAWIESFAVLYPDGSMRKADSRRDVILTDHEFGNSHLQMPIRALYYSKATNKPSILQTEEEELLELKPVTDALAAVLQT